MLEAIRNTIGKRKRNLVVFILILIILTLAGRLLYSRNKQPQYQTAKVDRMDLTKVLEVSGKVRAEESVDLHFQAAGKLVWVGVKEGDRVKKWQAIASLDKRTLEKQLKKDLFTFEKEYRDYRQSVEDNPLVNQRFKMILEKAQFDLDSAVIDVEIRDLAIELASLVSPIAGIITAIDTPFAGVNVTVSDAFSVVNPETVYFEAEIDEADVASLKEGQIANIVLDSYPDENLTSRVLSVDFQSSTSEGGGTIYFAKLSLPENEDLKFRLGMTGDADIILDEKTDVLSVPLDYLIERDGSYFVDILEEGNKLKRQEIKAGLITEEYAEVTSGLSENQEIVIPQ